MNISNIEKEPKSEESDIDESKDFNVDVWMYLAFEKENEEFTVIRVNLNITRQSNKEHLYKENDFYFELNNIRYYSIIWMSCIYNYYRYHLGSKATNNFFLKAIFKSIRKVYIKEEIRYWIFTTRTTIYGTFILLLKHLPIYIKEKAILKRC